MRAFILIFFIAVYATSLTKGQEPLETLENCVVVNLKQNYRNSIYYLIVLSYKAVAFHSNVNFVFSPRSIWLMLAAIAEGTDNKTQEQLFKLLNLPDDLCIRQKYYRIATSRIIPDNDVSIINTRALIIDENLSANLTWLDLVTKNHLLDVVTAPIKRNPLVTVNEIRRVMVADVPRLNLSGNSVLLDAIDYNGLWTTAFADAVIERSPFYSQEGVQIGAVDLMRVKRRARMGYVRSINAKVLELPVGSNGHYRMLLLYQLDKVDLKRVVGSIKNDIILEMFESLKESNVPIEVAVPRMEITSEVDVRTVLEDLGVTRLWTDPEATKYISNPPAFPSSYVQRATVTLNKHGVVPPPFERDPPPGVRTGLEPEVGRDFIANQPFLMGLFDVETYTPLIAVAYTKPTYVSRNVVLPEQVDVRSAFNK